MVHNISLPQSTFANSGNIKCTNLMGLDRGVLGANIGKKTLTTTGLQVNTFVSFANIKQIVDRINSH